jgi:RNA polymerase sigma factor (TIGR02999 family)
MSQAPITLLLEQWAAGDTQALDQLIPLTYPELRRLAARHMRREPTTNTLQPTALVHEAFLRIAGQKDTSWRTRAQFFGFASQIMRRILVDRARRRLSSKRGGGALKMTIDELESELDAQGASVAAQVDLAATQRQLSDILAVDAALRQLEALDARQARIVELRYFGGLTIDEIAQTLQLSNTTIKRDWIMARAWLSRALAASRAPP